MHTVIWLISALTAGVLARIVMRERGRGFVGDIVLGAVGSISGAWLLRIVNGEVPASTFTSVATAFVGAAFLVAAGRVAVALARGAQQLAADGAGAVGLADLEAQIRRLSTFERVALGQMLGRRQQPLGDGPPVPVLSMGERVADKVAAFGGSWTFLGSFAAFMLAWMFLNTTTTHPADPYPFILLNLVLSCLAAVQAPVIMMSQNRQAARDRLDAQQDYQVNLRAEMQITELHVKLDEARVKEWHALVLLHEKQLEVLERIEQSIAARRM